MYAITQTGEGTIDSIQGGIDDDGFVLGEKSSANDRLNRVFGCAPSWSWFVPTDAYELVELESEYCI